MRKAAAFGRPAAAQFLRTKSRSWRAVRHCKRRRAVFTMPLTVLPTSDPQRRGLANGFGSAVHVAQCGTIAQHNVPP